MSSTNKKTIESGKKRRVKPAEYIMLVAAAAVVVAIAIIAAGMFREETSAFTTIAPLYQYYGFKKTEYSGGSRIEVMEDSGEIVIKNDDDSAILDGTPLYYESQSRIVLLGDAVYMPRTGAPALVYRFGEALMRGDTAYIMNTGGEIAVDGGFLYDGSDLYVFLEPVTLNVGDESFELSPLSYAYVQYNRDVQYFDRENEQDFFAETGEGVIVTAEFADGRIVELNTDILYDVSGGWQLLINKPSAAKPLM